MFNAGQTISYEELEKHCRKENKEAFIKLADGVGYLPLDLNSKTGGCFNYEVQIPSTTFTSIVYVKAVN